MPISNPIPGVAMVIADTQVFNGTSPAAWADLDLSSVIGANPALVLLKISCAGYSFSPAAVRRKGDTDEFYDATKFGGVAAGETPNNDHTAYWVATDNAGVIQWITSSAKANTTVDVMAYIK